MRVLTAIGLVFLLVMQLNQSAVSAETVPPLEAFGNLPLIRDVRLSPDGKHFAAIQPSNGRSQVVIYKTDPAPGEQPILYGASDASADSVLWANNSRLICSFSANLMHKYLGTFDHWSRAVAINVDGTNPVVLLDAGSHGWAYRGIHVAYRDAGDDKHVYIEARAPVGGEATIYKTDIDTGKGEELTRGTRDTLYLFMDGSGKVLARMEFDRAQSMDSKYVSHLDLLEDKGWQEVLKFDSDANHQVDVEGVSVDGKYLYVSQYGDRNTKGLYPIDIATGAIEKPVFQDPEFDLDNAISDEWTGRVIGYSFISDKPESIYFDAKLQALQRGIERALPKMTVSIVSTDIAHDIYIVRSEAPRYPAVFQIYRPATHKLESINGEYPTLQPENLGEMTPYNYKSRDGLDIRAYLTLPPNGGRKLPLVVFPHGGPEARDYLSFDWFGQFLATRGYAVFQPNFRGSSGYGWKFESAGFKQWNDGVRNDIVDGVQKLIADGTVVDPKRICIAGMSFGGYAALSGVTFSNDLYKCAISYAGISSVEEMLGADAFHFGEGQYAVDYWSSRTGDVLKDKDAVRAMSPVFHVNLVKAPVLLMHSQRDLTVHIMQSEVERDALEKLHKPVTFVKLDGDDHYLRLAASRIKVLEETQKFLDQNLPR